MHESPPFGCYVIKAKLTINERTAVVSRTSCIALATLQEKVNKVLHYSLRRSN